MHVTEDICREACHLVRVLQKALLVYFYDFYLESYRSYTILVLTSI